MKNSSEEHHKAYIRQLIYDNKIIDAIKYIRDMTGMGLKESKELCEMFYNDMTKLDDYTFINDLPEKKQTEFKIPVSEDELFKNIKSMLVNNRKLMAIKYARAVLKIGLKEAKDLVDSLEDDKSERSAVILGENEDILTEVDSYGNIIDEDSSSIKLIEPDDQTEVNEEPDTLKLKIQQEKPKKKKKPKKEYKPITFGKVERFDKEKKRSSSNSGCMITLTLMIAIIIILSFAF